MKEIRLLTADEIECRVQSTSEKGASLLLYKDARVDMKILDETFGIFGWQRTHEVVNDNLFCTIQIFDKENNQWVKKQDVGVESNTEKEKGEASDSFKRAGFNIGIGRELYTAPFIWVKLSETDFNSNKKIKTKFHIEQLEYNDQREIASFIIKDENNKVRYSFGSKEEKKDDSDAKLKAVIISINNCKTPEQVIKIWNDNEDLKGIAEFAEKIKSTGTKLKNEEEAKKNESK
jgi:hypothetical protein